MIRHFLHNHKKSFPSLAWQELDFICSIICAWQNQRHVDHEVIYSLINSFNWKHFPIYQTGTALLPSQWVKPGYFCKIIWFNAPERNLVFDMWTTQKLFVRSWDKALSKVQGQGHEILGDPPLTARAVEQVWQGQRTTYRCGLSPSTTRLLGIKLWLPGMAASTLTHWAIFPAPRNIKRGCCRVRFRL